MSFVGCENLTPIYLYYAEFLCPEKQKIVLKKGGILLDYLRKYNSANTIEKNKARMVFVMFRENSAFTFTNIHKIWFYR